MSRPGPTGGDLAGRWLSRFLTSHLAAERDVSAQTIASYRDAIRLLLTWFRDVQAIPPEKLRLADIDRARVLAFLDWLQAERGNSASTRNQRPGPLRTRDIAGPRPRPAAGGRGGRRRPPNLPGSPRRAPFRRGKWQVTGREVLPALARMSA